MKKSLKIVALALILIMTFSASVFAQSAVMTGKTDVGAKGVTVLVVKKGATIQTMTGDDIVWIDQQNVQADGSFSIKLPIYSDTEYDVFSNATSKNVEEARIYVSQTGTGNGLSADSPTTLAEAYSQIDDDLEIVITEDMTYEDASAEYTGNLTIRGLSGTEKLTLPEIVSVKGNLKFDDIVLKTSSKLYANGYNLEIGENVKSDTLTVYGGKDGVSCKNTSLKIYGGTYGYIYGGGHHSGGKVTGSTNVVFGGNATAEYIHGAGCEAVASKTNITISGGVVNESVYGGMAGVPLTADTNILMTGGTVQSLYGGNSVTNLTGNTYITVKGGEVTRRIYGGCYNEYKFSWDSDGYVKGSTNIIIYPAANLITGSGLSLSDRTNMGIFGGSRRKADTEDEVNTIIFMDGSFDKYGSNVVKSGTLKSFHDYLVKSAVGGSVSPIENGKVVVNTKNGITALSNGARYQNGQTISLSAETTITYDGIISADIEETTATTKANADVAVSSSAVLFAAIYDDSEKLVSCATSDVTSTKDYTVDINCKLDANRKYTARLFLLTERSTLVPLSGSYTIEVR